MTAPRTPKSIPDRVLSRLQPAARELTEEYAEIPCVAIVVPWDESYPAGFVIAGETGQDKTTTLLRLLTQLSRLTGALLTQLENIAREKIQKAEEAASAPADSPTG